MHNGIDVGWDQKSLDIDLEGFHMPLAVVSEGQLYCAGHGWQDTTAAGSRWRARKKEEVIGDLIISIWMVL